MSDAPMDATPGLQDLLAWLRMPRRPALTLPTAVACYHGVHPRSTFIRMLPKAATVLDFGAGGGTLINYLTWPGPARGDIGLYAYSLDYARGFDAYRGYEVGRFETTPPRFDGVRFDALFASHVIEHLPSADDFLDWVPGRLEARARVYLEWPTPQTTRLPNARAFREHGYDIMISNFFEDGTHVRVPDRGDIRDRLGRHGFGVESEGVIRLPWLEEELLAHVTAAIHAGEPPPSDPTILLNAYWSKTGWAQYMVCSRGEP
jgi:SAM-dependent methyltransferase